MSLRSFCGLLAALTAVLAIVACGDSDAATTPTPSEQPPTATPPPSGVEIDLDRAGQLYYEGDFEGALTIYSAAAQAGSGDQKQAGLWAIARIQAQRGDNHAAELTLEAYRATEPDDEQDQLALLLLGAAEFAQGDRGEAKDAFQKYVSRGGAAWPYAYLYLAQIASIEGDAETAAEHTEQALMAGLPATVETEALMSLGDAYEKAGDEISAIDVFQRAVDAAADDDQTAEALWRLAGAAEEAGEVTIAAGSLAQLVVSYPGHDQALEALDHPLVATSGAVGTRERGLVLFKQRTNDAARSAFQAIVDAGGPGTAEAYYYLGILSERSAAWDDAISHYDAAIALLPPGTNDTLRAQGQWDRATVLELLGRTDEAIAAYAGVTDTMPTHDRAGEAVFQAGLLSYQQGRPGDAASYWQRFLEVAPNAEERARANYWLAEAWTALGDADTAGAYYAAAAEADPLDYYAMRARAVMTGATSFPDALQVVPSSPGWAGVESWLAGWAGPENAMARDALFEGEPWLRAVDLLEAGLDSRADAEFSDLVAENAGKPWLHYRLLRAIEGYGRPWVSSRAAVSLARRPGAPKELLTLVYPLEYLELAQKEALVNGFSPLLLLALVKQESLYRPDAVSPAEAMGLTQVVPSTADEIAGRLEVQDFKYTDLFRPRVSLRFGAFYLEQQIEGFGGQIAPALAAYNGGPGNSGQWWDTAGGDVDLFLETIEFPETRAYVELVLENYALYLWTYGLTLEPVLPLQAPAIE